MPMESSLKVPAYVERFWDERRTSPSVDLESVESRQGLVRNEVPLVDIIGSQKVSFEGLPAGNFKT